MTQSAYISIEELAETLNVSVSSIRTWLKAGYFSNAAYFNVNSVYRFRLDIVLEEIHSKDFGRSNFEKNDSITAVSNNSILEANELLSSEYEYLVSSLLKIISENLVPFEGLNDKLVSLGQEFLSEYNFVFGTEMMTDALSLLEHNKLDDVAPAIRNFILTNYDDDENRRQLLDMVGVFTDLGKIQGSLKRKLNDYVENEHNTREYVLKNIGIDYDSLEDELITEENILESLEEILTTFSSELSRNPENTKKVLEMRRKVFCDIYDFDEMGFQNIINEDKT